MFFSLSLSRIRVTFPSTFTFMSAKSQDSVFLLPDLQPAIEACLVTVLPLAQEQRSSCFNLTSPVLENGNHAIAVIEHSGPGRARRSCIRLDATGSLNGWSIITNLQIDRKGTVGVSWPTKTGNLEREKVDVIFVQTASRARRGRRRRDARRKLRPLLIGANDDWKLRYIHGKNSERRAVFGGVR